MPGKIRVGIIGQGRSGHNIHVHALKQMTGKYKIAAVADPLEGRTDDAVLATGCAAYSDYRDMLERKDLDLVVNATPSHLHVPVTKEIMDAGFNVLCEKPLARYVSEVDELIEKAKNTKKVFAVFQQSRFAPYYRQVKKVVDSGVLGRIVQVRIAFNGFARRWDWQTMQEFYAGSLLNTGPHPLDQALTFFGFDGFPKVTCIMDRANTFGDAEDHVKLILHGEFRPTIDLEISSCDAYHAYTYRVYGTRGSLQGTMNHIDWKYFKLEEAPEQHLITEPLPDRKYCSEKLKWHENSWDLPEAQKDWFTLMTRAFYTNLHGHITKGTPLEVTPEQVRKQIWVIEECHKQNPLSKMPEW